MTEFPIRTAQQLSSHLRSLRQTLGLTQAQLGKRLGIEQARVAKIERNPGSISVDQLLELLHALDTTLILRRSENEKKPSAQTSTRVSW